MFLRAHLSSTFLLGCLGKRLPLRSGHFFICCDLVKQVASGSRYQPVLHKDETGGTIKMVPYRDSKVKEKVRMIVYVYIY